MKLDVQAIRAGFPALSIRDDGKPRYYFDNPAGTQVHQSVVERMGECLLESNANLGGFFSTSDLAGEVVAGARRAMADFLNAPSVDEIIFGQNMTSLTLHLARTLGTVLAPGDEIVLTRMDHDANVEPWQLMARDHDLIVRWLPFSPESFEFDLADLDKVLNERTRLVCVGAASNLTGTVNPVAEICRRAREAGAWVFVDAVQAAPHIATDVQETGCDFLTCSAYKFFGPHQGILWGRGELLEMLSPWKVRPAPDSIPACFEPGTQSHEGMHGTAAAIDYLAELGGGPEPGLSRRERIVAAFDSIVAHEQTLSVQLIDGLASIRGVRIQGITAKDAMDRRVPTVSFVHDSSAPQAIARALADRAIFAWSGHNYAIELAGFLGLLDTGGVVRIGPVHYNTKEEVNFLLNALEDILD